MYEVLSTKYNVPPFDILHWAFSVRHWFQFRISPACRRQVSRTFYPFIVLRTWYFVPHFDIPQSAVVCGQWTVSIKIPIHSFETHCLRPALLSLLGVLYCTARGGGSFSFSRRSLHAAILLQSNGDFTGQQGSYLECAHPRKATSNSCSRCSD